MTRELVDLLFTSTSLSNCINAAVESKLGKKVLLIDKNPFFGDIYDTAFTFKQLLSHPPPELEIKKIWCNPELGDTCIDIGVTPLLANGFIINSCINAELSEDYLSMMEIKPIYYLHEGRYYKVAILK